MQNHTTISNNTCSNSFIPITQTNSSLVLLHVHVHALDTPLYNFAHHSTKRKKTYL